MKDTMSLYKSMAVDAPNTELSLFNYCGFIKNGTYQDEVIRARAFKQKALVKDKTDPDYKMYMDIKKSMPYVTGSAVMKQGDRKEDNIKSMNGLIVIDIDTEVNDSLIATLRADQYTRVIHRSFGGDGVCIFVRINQLKDFRDSFEGLAQYYLDNYNVTVDASCKNPNRLRFMSYDIDLYENEKSKVFTHKAKKKQPKPAELNYIFAQDDFDNILEQIKEKHVDLCDEDYSRYVKIGMALASKFGESGKEKFHFICSFGAKYNAKDAERDYNGFCRKNIERISIATIYYYAKEAGLNLYSEKTKQIINRVKVAKSQGTPTVDSISVAMANIHNVAVNESDKDLIVELIKSDQNFAVNANDGTTETEQLINYIIETYEPIINGIRGEIHINGSNRPITDKCINTMLLNANIVLDFKVFKNDIMSVLESDRVKVINVVQDFFKENQHDEVGHIEECIRCIEPYNEYNLWAFKKWLVGMVHNWTADFNEPEVSPLTLVLTGKGGTGKSSFFRYLLPEQLKGYHVEKKINPKDKDDFYLLATSLMLVDEEFGGAVKDVKDYKAMSDANMITQRRPFGKVMETFKRRAGLGGNSNDKNVQRDVTGNRRILPIPVARLDYDRFKEIDKVKVFVEAYNELKAIDFDWRIYSDEDKAYLKKHSEEHEEVMPIEEIFDTFFSLEQTTKFSEKRILNQGDILSYLTLYSAVKPTKFDVKDIITKKGLEYKPHEIGNQVKKKGFRLYVNRSVADASYNSRESDN